MEKEITVRDSRNGDWFWANNLVLNHPYLTSSAKITYCALTSFADNNTQKAYPSIETLSELTHVKRPTVINSIKQLEKYSFIKVNRRDGKVNRYILLKVTDRKPVKKVDWSKKGKKMFLPGNGRIN